MKRSAAIGSLLFLTTMVAADGELTWGSVEIDGAQVRAELRWMSDQSLAGFQFECLEGAFLAAGGGQVTILSWEVYFTESMVLAFTLDPALSVPPQSAPVHLISVTVPLSQGELTLSNPIFSDPFGEMILISGPGTLVLPDPCPADLDGDGLVGVDDVLAVLGFWGGGSGGDANGDGSTDVDDMLAVIADWGPC